MMKMGFSINLKRIIKARSLKLTDISQSTGIPMSTLSEWTAGREPKVSEALVKLSDHLGVSLDELILDPHHRPAKTELSDSSIITIEGKRYRVRFERIT